MRGAGGLRRTVAAAVGVAVVVGAVAVVETVVAAQESDLPEWMQDVAPSSSEDDPVSPEWAEPEVVPDVGSVPSDPGEFAWPEPGSDAVTLGDPGEEVAVGDAPLELAAGAASVEGAELEVAVRDREAAEAAGVSGFVFEVSAAEGGVAELAGSGEVPVDLKVDYTGFSEAFGGSYADRLQVVALPPCALESSQPAGCRIEGFEVPSHVNAETEQLVVDVADLGSLVSSDGLVVDAAAAAEAAGPELPAAEAEVAPNPVEAREGGISGGPLADGESSELAGGSVVLALTSGASGETGDFGASPLSSSSSWQVAPGSGEFTWSYDMAAPAPSGGAAPSVGLSYSSGAVDGLTMGSNAQSGPSGVGWSDFASSFVERRYESCSHGSMGSNVKDLCWAGDNAGDNATISLNGRASQLLPIDTAHTQWRLASDPGWLVKRIGTIPNEHWEVVTPDGTRYIFGTGSVPASAAAGSVPTKSRWTVPVWADDSGEPCRGPGNTVGMCDQAWRWNLERVVDPHGIETQYFYEVETNKYRILGGWGSADEDYIRAGRLRQINYGVTPFGVPTAGQPGRVTPAFVFFDSQNRCHTLDDLCSLVPPTPSNGNLYPDVPNDLICTGSCAVTTPTFFTTTRYSAVYTKVKVAGIHKFVDVWNLGAAFQDNGENDTHKMYLNSIQNVGISEDENGNETLVNMPAVNFLGAWKFNRVDINLTTGKLPMSHQRLTTIVDEYGHQTLVDYGQDNTCALNYNGPWDTNQKDCFPVYSRTGTAPSAVFHKYLTTRVREVDPTGGSPTVDTTYDYEGQPALRYAIDFFMPGRAWTWNDWRGYGSVVVTQGSSRTRLRVFRGMHGDKKYAAGQAWPTLPTGVRTVSPLTSQMDPSLPSEQDDNWLAGAGFEEQRLGTGTSPPILEATVHSYTRITDAPPGWPAGLNYADWVGEDNTYMIRRRPDNSLVRALTTTTYDTTTYQPTSVFEDGDTSVAGDERCTKSTYAQDVTAWKVVYPATAVTLAGNCASTTELSRSETYYDNHTSVTAAPTRGDATKQRIQIDNTTWVDTVVTGYDTYGRIVAVTDAKGNETNTSYDEPGGGSLPTSTTVTNAELHETTTYWNRRGLAKRVVDPNDGETTSTYDAFGRVLTVRGPAEQAAGVDSQVFQYYVKADKSAPPIVRSGQLIETGPSRYVDSWVLYDTFGRTRETQALSPTSGKVIVTKTNYDERGLVRDVTASKAYTGTAGVDFLATTSDNWTRYTYDVLGREVTATGMNHSDPNKWTATSAYTHNTVTATPAVGGAARSTVDGLGRVTKVEEEEGPLGQPSTGWATTTYGYDLADNLTTVTDPAGNDITYTYNKVGWRLTSDDPDSGAASYTYDVLGNQQTVTDALNQTVWTGYDALNRPTSRRVGSSTGAELARWDYDTLRKGQLDRSIQFSPQGQWVNEIDDYDDAGRPVETTQPVPAGIPGLTGSYTTTIGYDRAGNVTTTGYPAIPGTGLPAETVTTDYSTIGLPETLTGIDTYVWSTGYDDRGRPSESFYGPHPSNQAWMGRQWAYNNDDRIESVTTNVGGYNIAHTFGFDDAGNLKTRTTDMGTQSWRECYVHDRRSRMTDAFTLPKATDCATGTATPALRGTGGGTPYNHAYTYSADGKLLARTENGVTDTYSYPTGTDPDRSHAPTTVGTGPAIDEYTWNANGALIERTVDGDTETLAWDIEGHLESVTGPDGTDSYTYDTGGQRLLRTTPAERTLYVAGHEIRANLTGTTVTATRNYAFGGQLVATRTGNGPAEYLTSDQQGSVEASAPAGQTPDVTRTYNPYGKRRSGGELDSDRGWLGQVEDDTTDLAYLNARYYDPNINTFISPDPIFDPASPQTINPYAYGLGNPMTMSDPSGLIPDGLTVDRWRYDPYAYAIASTHGGTKQSSKAQRQRHEFRRQNPTYHYKMPTTTAQKANAVAAVQLTAMARANPDPAFWQAVAAHGALGMQVIALSQANPDPAHWSALAAAVSAAGSYENFVRTANARRSDIYRWETVADAVKHPGITTQFMKGWRAQMNCDFCDGKDGSALGTWWTKNKQDIFRVGDGLGLLGAGISAASYLSFPANPLGPIEGAVIAEASDKITDISNGIQTLDTCFHHGLSSLNSSACGESASTSLLIAAGDLATIGFPTGTALSVFTDSNDTLTWLYG